MVVTPADLVSAMFFLVLLEGFRRVRPHDLVLTRWRSRWSTKGSPRAIWFRTIEWLWVLPLQTDPATFLCSRNNTAWDQQSSVALKAVETQVSSDKRRYKRLCLLTTVQACVILFLLPPLAVVGSSRIIYSGLAAVLLIAVLITVAAWPINSWRSLKYMLYPPSSVFAVTDATIESLAAFDFDAVVATLLPYEDALPLLRRHYRSRSNGPAQTEAERDRVQARMTSLMRARGFDVHGITRAPERSSENVLTYCPCCDGEFVLDSGECSECEGVKLMPFAKATAK
jgi:hypothetical protein